MRHSLLVIIVILAAGCSTDIDLVGEGEPVPIVYGILDAADSIHYVKIMKSFSGKASAEDLLQEDLLYYHNPEVHLIRDNNSQSFDFTRVSLPGKEEGFFPISPNYVYRLDHQLSPGVYTISIHSDEFQADITHQVNVFSDLELIYPAPLTKRIYFYDDPVSFTWKPTHEAASYELAFVLTFEEARETETTNKTISYSRSIRLEELEWYADRLTFRLYSDPFFATIGRKLTTAEEIRYRKPLNLQVSLTAADEDLTQFMNQISPDTPIETHYTGNLPDAIGIIAAKFSVTLDNKQLSPKAMDSLRSGRFTNDLKFVANPVWQER